MKKVPTYKYMYDFQCTGPDCIDTCCHGWEIYVSKNEKKKIDKAASSIPDISFNSKELFQRNRKSPSDLLMYKINLTEKNFCGMMDKQGLCLIHKYLGEEYLPKVCATYPKSLVSIDQELELSGSLSCPEVAKLCLLNTDAFQKCTKEIRLDMTEIAHSITPGKYSNVLSKNILHLRDMFVGFLQIKDIDYKSRFFLSVYFAFKIKDCKSDQELLDVMSKFTSGDYISEILQQFSLLPNPEKNFSLNFIKTILIAGRTNASGDTALFDLIRDILSDLGGDTAEIKDVNEFYNKRLDNLLHKDQDKINLALTNYGMNFVTRSYFTAYDSLESYFYEMLMLTSTFKFLVICHPKLNSIEFDDIIVDAAYRLARSYEHNPVYLSHIREKVQESEFLTLAHLANLIML